MTRKTGKMAVKARQQMRAARLAKYTRELSDAGVKLTLPKPSAAARREKEEELKRLYLEMFPAKKEEGEQAGQPQEQEQPEGQAEQKEEEKRTEEKETEQSSEQAPDEKAEGEQSSESKQDG